MPDLTLSWGALTGGYATQVIGSQTVDTGGVAVTVTSTGESPDAAAFTMNSPTYVNSGEGFAYQSSLKLFGNGSTGPGTSDTSVTTLDFTSTDAAYADSVSNLTFRLHDVDAGALSDVDNTSTGSPHQDIVSIRAYAPDGTEIPVSITPGSAVTLSGQTLTGTTQGVATDGPLSSLVTVAGPVARIEIDYDNGAGSEQEIFVSDLQFSTVDVPDNTAPIANPDAGTTPEGTLISDIDVLGNDSDPEGNPLTVTAASAANGTVSINTDGTLNYTPNAGFTGVDTISYTISDGSLTASSTVAMTVTPANDAPVAVDDSASTAPGTPVTLLPLINDSDPDGDSLSITAASSPDGTVTIASDGQSVEFTPNAAFTGTAQVNYTISDGNGGTASAVISVRVDTGPDGIVSGTAGADLIVADNPATPGVDEAYTGDPDGDQVDSSDAILPGHALQDDVIQAGAGDDTIYAGAGDDTVDGGAGDDLINTLQGHPDAPAVPASADGDNSVTAGTGNDTVLTGDGDDTVSGGTGSDSITSGGGADSILGGAGDDTVAGGAGADTISTGDGQDVIIGASVGDVVDGGSGGPIDNDTLDLRGAGDAENPGGKTLITYTSADREDGTVSFLDASGTVTGTMSFTDIETVIPCFTPGTMIATPQGERPVEKLEVGDPVITRDNGIQRISWIGKKEVSGADMAQRSHLRPVLIRAGALGRTMPERDILVSPQHRMLISTEQSDLLFDEREVLVAAKHLTHLDGIDEVISDQSTTYIHIMFPQHEVVLSNGTWSESFQPGDLTLQCMESEQRQEILELFPELNSAQGIESYHAARRALRRHEAKLLVG